MYDLYYFLLAMASFIIVDNWAWQGGVFMGDIKRAGGIVWVAAGGQRRGSGYELI
jgi:hypothetical protein